MGSGSLPPGFRFHPRDEELVGYYLKRKVEGLPIELEVIPVIDLYNFDPWELPEKSFLPKRDMEWFFFCPRDRKYPNGSRTNRATKAGYWKATGKDRKINCQSSVMGYRKTLVFHRGRAPSGDRMDWVMHEYRLCDEFSHGTPNFKGAFALCRIVKKNDNLRESKGNIVGNGRDIEDSTSMRLVVSNELSNISKDDSSQTNFLTDESRLSSPITSSYNTNMMSWRSMSIMETNREKVWISPDLILDSSKLDYTEMQGAMSICFPWFDYSGSTIPWSSYEYSNYIGDVELKDDNNQIGSCILPYSTHLNRYPNCL
ncbi:NAC domain-containing protein 71-like isoform X1 [Cucurbita maxima]|uniref:NAC domain-containing protein 71-like isoform X1 n=1 Tax=Cucurbita maxima TaxID=3661 RepID=A0A6J1I8K4_CUCMA|nr:NAC domain-containing protein 71-like isoform X1 [Cucurbita maxima]